MRRSDSGLLRAAGVRGRLRWIRGRHARRDGARRGLGLRQIFSFCRGFTDSTDLLAWMKNHSQAPAANYVNWIGRTVRQVREEARLRDELVACVMSRQDEFRLDDPPRIRAKLLEHCQPLLKDGRLRLSPEEPTPLGWRVRNLLHYAIVPAALLLPWLMAIPMLDPLPSLLPLFRDARRPAVRVPGRPHSRRVRLHRRFSASCWFRCSSCSRF